MEPTLTNTSKINILKKPKQPLTQKPKLPKQPKPNNNARVNTGSLFTLEVNNRAPGCGGGFFLLKINSTSWGFVCTPQESHEYKPERNPAL